VLVRILPSGALDTTFGQGGQAIVAPQIGINTEPHVALGADGRIAYTFFVNGSPAYFVIYVLRADGVIDTTAPSSGRISVLMPNATVNLGQLTVKFSVDNLSLLAFGSVDSSAQFAAMRWAVDVRPGATTTIPLPTFTNLNLAAGAGVFDVALGGNVLWVAAGEDRVTFERQGFHTLDTYQRGAIWPIYFSQLGSTPVTISAVFVATPYTEVFDYLQWQPEGGPLLLGRASKYLTWSTLSKMTFDGDYVGQVRSQFNGTSSAESRVLLRSKVGDGGSTILSTAMGCSVTLQCGLTASLILRNSAGGLVDTFGTSGSVSLPSVQLAGSIGAYTPGEVSAGSEVSVLSALTQDNATIRLEPLVLDSAGRPKAGFSAAVQLVPLSSSISLWQSRLNQLPDGRWQAIAPSNHDQKVTLGVARWLSDGNVDPSLTSPLLIDVPTIGGDPYVLDMDSIVLGDGSTLVAIWELSQRIVLRLLPNGGLDPSFGTGGTIRIDGLIFPPSPTSAATNPLRIRLALQPDGKFLLAYSIKLGSGTALAVARFTPDGHPDTTFTADGQFDSVFSLSGNEQASDISVLSDGKILVAGSSNGRALLLRLKGEAAEPVVPQFVVEFYNSILDHYFVTASTAEATAIEMGSAGPGWQRTGYSFKNGGAAAVCRFYGNANLNPATGTIYGPNSHFYTADPQECSGLKALYTPTGKSWKFEGNDFATTTPLFAAYGATTCPAGTIPIFRAYNNGFAQGIDSNHRLTSSRFAMDELTSSGWIAEGIAMCAPN